MSRARTRWGVFVRREMGHFRPAPGLVAGNDQLKLVAEHLAQSLVGNVFVVLGVLLLFRPSATTAL